MRLPALLRRRLWLLPGLILLGLFLLHAARGFRLDGLDFLERHAYDLRVLATIPDTVDDRIVIADIDEHSLEQLGRWPWDRYLIAQLVDTLFDHYHVRAAGFDVVFAEADEDSGLDVLKQLADGPLRTDRRFQQEFQRRAPELDYDGRFGRSLHDRDVVLGMVFAETDPTRRNPLPKPFAELDPKTEASLLALPRPRGHTAALPALTDSARMSGYFDNPLIDPDGVFRRVPLFQLYEHKLFPSLAFATAYLALGSPPVNFRVEEHGDYRALEGIEMGPYFIPVDEQGAALVPWRGGARRFPYVSIVDILNKRIPLATLQDRVVFVGTTAPGLLDLRSTPVANAYPGVEIHANIVSGIFDDMIRHRPAWVIGAETSLQVLIGLMMLLITARLSPLGQVLLSLTLGAGIVSLNLAAWNRGYVLPLAAPLALLALLFTYLMAYGFIVEARSRHWITRTFGQYIPPELVKEIANQPDSFSLKGEARELTVLFSDIRDFTSISEALTPTDLTALMNRYLTVMTQVIHRHRGTIDKYIGDAIMAFWGAPVHDEQHARNALLAAIDMKAALLDLATEFQQRGWPVLHIGIGINTGVMNVGNMGSEFRMAYTVMGDAVNLASRLESLSKQYGVALVVSESVRDAVPELVYRCLDCVRVKGKTEPVRIYEPVGPQNAIEPEELHRIKWLHTAQEAYCHRHWDHAEEILRELADTDDRPLYRLYLDRIAHFRTAPPPEDWDGVYSYQTK